MEFLFEAGRLGHWGYWGGDGGWVVGGFLWLLLTAGLVAAAMVLVLRAAAGARGQQRLPASAAPTPTPGPDPAVTELRLRYARGDITREEYVRTAADLGVAVPGDEPPPAPSA